MPGSWAGWFGFIHPVTVGIAVHRAAACVEDLTQLRQLWQQRPQADEAIDEGVSVALLIHLLISFWAKAEHSGAAVLEALQQLLWICGIADHHVITQLTKSDASLLSRCGQGQAQLRSSWLQPSRQGLTHIATTNNRQFHDWCEQCDDLKDVSFFSR